MLFISALNAIQNNICILAIQLLIRYFSRCLCLFPVRILIHSNILAMTTWHKVFKLVLCCQIISIFSEKAFYHIFRPSNENEHLDEDMHDLWARTSPNPFNATEEIWSELGNSFLLFSSHITEILDLFLFVETKTMTLPRVCRLECKNERKKDREMSIQDIHSTAVERVYIVMDGSFTFRFESKQY